MIELADGLSLDASEAATQTFAPIASKGGGKTYLATKFAEGLYDAGVPFAALDPVGNWSALTLGVDGKSPGLSIVVIGGERADIPLDVEHADRLGTFLVSQGLQAVIDLSELSKKKRKEFVADLCEAMFREARTQRSPFMIIFEEAQLFAPQHAARGEERMLGAVTDIVRLGRNYGLGSMLVTQRPQSVSKEVLNQVECLMVGQLRGPQERKAIRGWITEQGAGVTKEVLDDLPGLSPGEFCVWSPSWLRIFKRVRVASKRTFDGSSTPKLGEARAQTVKSQRNIGDVVRLLEKLFAPAEAKREPAEGGSFEVEAEKLAAEVAELVERSERAEGRARDAEAQLVAARQAMDTLERVFGDLREALRGLPASAPEASPVARLPAGALTKSETEPRRGAPVMPGQLGIKPAARHAARPPAKGTSGMDKPSTAILGVLAPLREPIPKARLALLAGYSPKGGAFNNCLSRLRVAGWIEGSSELAITRAGRAVAPKVPPLPTGEELLEHWRTHPRMDTPMRVIFWALVNARGPLTKDEIGRKTGYSATAGAFNNAISRLRVLGLIHGKGKAPLRLDSTLEEAATEAA